MTDLSRIDADIKSTGIDEENFRQILMIKLPEDSKENVVNVIRQLEKIEGIKYAGPNHIDWPTVEPDDTYYKPPYDYQWGLNGTYGIQAPTTWDTTTGSHSVFVGIIDTGISSHPDIDANLANGWNFENNNGNTSDIRGHGTHVAGIAGMVGDNGQGGAGVCWRVYLVPLKVDNSNGGIPISNVTAAIHYATSSINIRILNYSGGGDTNNYAREQAIRNFPGLFVCSAGNGTNNNGIARNNDLKPHYPSNHRLPNLLAVGSIDSNGNRSSFSNWGSNTVDIFAPGGSIYSTLPPSLGNSYGYYSGTSMAAPQAAGVAALMLSVNPNLTGAQLKRMIRSTAVQYPALLNDPTRGKLCVSGGRLNAHMAVLAAYINNLPPNGTNNPHYLPVSMNLGDMTAIGSGWQNLLSAIESAGRYVNLDLSTCAMNGTVFNPDAFNGNSGGKSFIVSIILPDATRSIASGSVAYPTFMDFLSLKSISGKNIESIGGYAFYCAHYSYSSLKSIDFPKVTNIGEYAFYGNYFMNSVTLGIICIAENFLINTFPETNYEMTHARFPSASGIRSNGFNGCYQMTSVSIPNVTIIDPGAFSSCPNITSVTAGSGLTTFSGTNQGARMTAFRSYYFSINPANARGGTYTWNGSAWTGPF